MAEDTVVLTPDVDLVHSPDDGGYYLHHYGTSQTSQIFPTAADARRALVAREVEWS